MEEGTGGRGREREGRLALDRNSSTRSPWWIESRLLSISCNQRSSINLVEVCGRGRKSQRDMKEEEEVKQAHIIPSSTRSSSSSSQESQNQKGGDKVRGIESTIGCEQLNQKQPKGKNESEGRKDENQAGTRRGKPTKRRQKTKHNREEKESTDRSREGRGQRKGAMMVVMKNKPACFNNVWGRGPCHPLGGQRAPVRVWKTSLEL